MKIFLALLLFSNPTQASDDCLTAAILDDNSDYEACRITVDGKETDYKIPESSCAAYCHLRQAKKMNSAYQKFKPGKRSPASSDSEEN